MNILLLAGNTLRSRAYAQQLGRIPSVTIKGIFYGFEERACSAPELNAETQKYLQNAGINVPDLSESLVDTFKLNGWDFLFVQTIDVNSQSIIDTIGTMSPDLVVFSGYGGQILSENHFKSGIQYLHMHPGRLPSERGSTTIYYSILGRRGISVSAFFMSSRIDDGGIVLIKNYDLPNRKVNIDSWLDNCLRADCLSSAISKIVKKDEVYFPHDEESQEFFIIHPLLKHISILSLPD